MDKLDTSNMTMEQMRAELDRLTSQNAELTKEIKFKVSPKGGVSVYGLQRLPTTLYKEQWRKLMEHSEELLKFIQEHESELPSLESHRQEKGVIGRK